MKKNLLSIASLAVFVLFFGASATQQATVEPLSIPQYSFQPPSTADAGSAKIKIALFKPNYSGNFTYSSQSPFSTFSSNMNKDLEQILTAKGYIIKGPFETYDEMMYGDKKECDLGLFSDIDLNITNTSGGWMQLYKDASYFKYMGTLTISGKITFYISETFSRQKLLVKSISIPQKSIEVSSRTYNSTSNLLPLNDSGVHNPISKALEEFYQSAMKKAWDMLEVEQLKSLKNQTKDIRAHSSFQSN